MEKLPYRAIVSDLDGTLLNAEHKVGDFTIATLENLATKGVDIFLATGRNYPDVKHIISKISLDDAMLITSNGARVNKLNGEVVANHYIDEDIAFNLMNLDIDYEQVSVNSYQGDYWYIDRDIPEMKQYNAESGFFYTIIDFKAHHGKETEKVFYVSLNPKELAKVQEKITALYGDYVQITRSLPICLEIMKKGVCKANALKEVAKSRGYSIKDCIAFGDGFNDLEMLEEVGKGCVMGNAESALKERLSHLEVIGENKDESVARYLADIFR